MSKKKALASGKLVHTTAMKIRKIDKTRARAIEDLKYQMKDEARSHGSPEYGLKPKCKKCGSQAWYTAAWTEDDGLFPFTCLDCPDWYGHQ